jgi:hypothetical protein
MSIYPELDLTVGMTMPTTQNQLNYGLVTVLKIHISCGLICSLKKKVGNKCFKYRNCQESIALSNFLLQILLENIIPTLIKSI